MRALEWAPDRHKPEDLLPAPTPLIYLVVAPDSGTVATRRLLEGLAQLDRNVRLRGPRMNSRELFVWEALPRERPTRMKSVTAAAEKKAGDDHGDTPIRKREAKLIFRQGVVERIVVVSGGTR